MRGLIRMRRALLESETADRYNAAEKVTVSELRKLKFPPFYYDPSIASEVTSLPGFSESSNMFANCVTIFRTKKRVPHSSPARYYSEYEVRVCADAWGESAENVKLPQGSRMADAVQEAFRIAEFYAKKNQLLR